MTDLQGPRFWLRAGFFALFVLAPPLDLFRLDLNLGHFIVFGQDWTLGLEPFLRDEIGPFAASLNLLWRVFLPIALIVGVGIWVSWRYGRLYCGWLCPHFSVVEIINGLMRRASGKPTLWEGVRLPERQADGRNLRPRRAYWWLVAAAVLGFAFLWSLTLLTYLLPPKEIYHNLWYASLTRNQGIFLGVATTIFALEFFLARHLFCRYGCAIGLFQSLAWMGNPKALLVNFDRGRARRCLDCNNACDNACPMRLQPRTIKRKMFTCTQCGQCISACADVQSQRSSRSLLQWRAGQPTLARPGRCNASTMTNRR